MIDPAGLTAATTDDTVVDVEFEIIPDDIHAAGRAFYRGRRSPTLVYAVMFVAIGALFWWLGNPIGGAIMVFFALVVYSNPRVGFLDRWMAKRLPGNRIGSHWRIEIGPRGFTFTSEGVSGQVEWQAVESVIVRDEAVLVMGRHNFHLVNIPRRAMTAWQVAALEDLVRTFAPKAQLTQ